MLKTLMIFFGFEAKGKEEGYIFVVIKNFSVLLYGGKIVSLYQFEEFCGVILWFIKNI